MTALYFQIRVRDLAAQSRPSRALNLSPLEGVGNAGCPLHPQPRVRFALVKSTRVNEYTGITRRSRTQWFYDLFRALPGDRACLPPSSADRFCLSPVGPTPLRELDASVGASGPHDFAVRNNISRPRAVDRSQTEARPAIPSRAKRCRVHRIPPRVRDDGQRPSGGVGWREFVEMICPTGEAKYFCKGDWTAQNQIEKSQQIARMAHGQCGRRGGDRP